MARQTKDRILEVSLAMFNAQGEPNVTTNHIADELEISPGNLYYHYRNKENIVEHIFARYETRMDQALLVPDDRLPTLEDVWLQLHMVFECMWDYRFLYRDLVDILSRNRKLRSHFARILTRAGASTRDVLTGLAQAGIVRATADEIRATAENVLLVTTFWLNFNAVRGSGDLHKIAPSQEDLTHGIYQVMLLIAPFLRDAERVHLNTLAQAYRR
ncbi:MAG: TetR/AcrR family transcriptional regulator [Proteobacteria bacterium]|uniref:TetR/AcrR family transcriptional regulator n=1 Tax=Rudaea sp. TaxID=2136325 RepID=UPI001DB8C611|nr:TetR/AcrR family transcriptional regulator [Pseudomonadota bacterium]MBS0567202.1 TetR/AcrR family transcriptional regulator [Pseudomonadota bacterium]